ncbi:hypothetical protein C8R43DRAFT_1239839 [Mycena crocata]|nr:hypothetical protein C8R43DRAFT_1239839 [Mycena crocata]
MLSVLLRVLLAVATTILEVFIIAVPSSCTLNSSLRSQHIATAATSILHPTPTGSRKSTCTSNIPDIPDASLHVIGTVMCNASKYIRQESSSTRAAGILIQFLEFRRAGGIQPPVPVHGFDTCDVFYAPH